jgi:hypothetical protein
MIVGRSHYRIAVSAEIGCRDVAVSQFAFKLCASVAVRLREVAKHAIRRIRCNDNKPPFFWTPSSGARVVFALNGYYKNIFRETHASWPQTRDGFELIRQKYPDSLELISGYCRLACLAEDRVVARKLFDQLGGRMIANIWGDQKDFQNYRNWAYSR